MMGGFADSGRPITQKGSVQRRERAALGTRLPTHPHTRHVLL